MSISPGISLAELYAPIERDLAAAQRVFDGEIESELGFVNDMCATVRSYRGKMLRPALLLLSGRATGEVAEAHHTAAAVVEMVHMATLVHDDVLDGADLRRQKATIAASRGNSTAVLLGDYLISHAFHLCSSLPDGHVSRRIGATTNIVCEGELLQAVRRGDIRLSIDDYLGVIRRKTAALTAVACELGAYLSGADAGAVSALAAFGEEAGIAFQIMDDVLDLIGDQTVLGKTTGRDVAQGNLTLPLIHALRQGGETEAALIPLLLDSNGDCAGKISGILFGCGSIDFATQTACDYVARALSQLEGLAHSPARHSLISLAEFILDRSY